VSHVRASPAPAACLRGPWLVSLQRGCRAATYQLSRGWRTNCEKTRQPSLTQICSKLHCAISIAIVLAEATPAARA